MSNIAMNNTKISVQNKFVESTECQMVISVNGSEIWTSSPYPWILLCSEHAIRVNGSGKGSCSFKNIHFISHLPKS